MKRYFILHSSFFISLLLTSCSIMDYEGDCTPYYRARFTYDHHLHYSDAFAGQVQSVALYAFDEGGRYVACFRDRGEALEALRKAARNMGDGIERSIQPRQQERGRRRQGIR